MAIIKRNRDNIHYSLNNLLSYNKVFNFAVSGRGPGKTTDTARYMMTLHKKGYMIVLLKRMIVDVNETTIQDFCNAYNVLMPEEEKISLVWKKGDMKTGICDVYIEGEEVPFFRIIALANPKYRLKGMAFDRELALVVFDEYKISGTEKYLPDEYGKFQELYATLCRFGAEGRPPRVLFLGNNYSLTDPYIANMKIPVSEIQPGKIVAGENFAFEDIKINEELKNLLLQQNPLFNFGDDAYNKYALEGISVSDQRIIVKPKQPENFSLKFVFYIENKYLGIFAANDASDPNNNGLRYWISVLEDYEPSRRREIACFDYFALIEGNYLLSRTDYLKFILVANAFRHRQIAYKTIYEGYLFEQIYEML